ncbi:hypothetical protein ACIQ9Q_29795 [Streptomyces sp. NPDC094438]|uniref:hypothetical protein n=1 Tax=Streptomyces sp. NPDC094438 TaxID=3366061 RepID=UPI00380A1C78
MTTCPTHQNSAPPPPQMPHSTRPANLVCKGCAAPAGSQEERRSHHCPCCGERFVSGCTGRPRRRTCHRCGTLDTHADRWLPPVDPIAELLGQHYTPSPWFRVWEEAARRFGGDIAHHLVQVTTEIDQTHLYGEIAFRGSVIAVRHGERGFEAASDCPHRAECRRGRLWTPVQIREDLLDVRLNGPGPRASACDRAHRHS